MSPPPFIVGDVESETSKAAAKDKLRRMGQRSRAVGGAYELKKGDELAAWWGCPREPKMVPVKSKKHQGKLRRYVERKWFCKSPLSGGWNRFHGPSDVLVPPDCPLFWEFKFRKLWSLEGLLLGAEGPDSIMGWWRKAWDDRDRSVKDGAPAREVVLVFARTGIEDLAMVRKSVFSRFSLPPGTRVLACLKPAVEDGAVWKESVVVFKFSDLMKSDPEPLKNWGLALCPRQS